MEDETLLQLIVSQLKDMGYAVLANHVVDVTMIRTSPAPLGSAQLLQH
jgi:hypothetical protein